MYLVGRGSGSESLSFTLTMAEFIIQIHVMIRLSSICPVGIMANHRIWEPGTLGF